MGARHRASPTTRAQDIMAATPGQWAHYEEQASAPEPRLDPARLRGGLDLLEIAVDVRNDSSTCPRSRLAATTADPSRTSAPMLVTNPLEPAQNRARLMTAQLTSAVFPSPSA